MNLLSRGSHVAVAEVLRAAIELSAEGASLSFTPILEEFWFDV